MKLRDLMTLKIDGWTNVCWMSQRFTVESSVTEFTCSLGSLLRAVLPLYDLGSLLRAVVPVYDLGSLLRAVLLYLTSVHC